MVDKGGSLFEQSEMKFIADSGRNDQKSFDDAAAAFHHELKIPAAARAGRIPKAPKLRKPRAPAGNEDFGRNDLLDEIKKRQRLRRVHVGSACLAAYCLIDDLFCRMQIIVISQRLGNQILLSIRIGYHELPSRKHHQTKM